MTKTAPEREFRTASDLPRERLYGPESLPGAEAHRPARRLPVHPRPARRAATAGGCGPCGSTPASAPPPSRTAATATSSSRARPASPWPSTCPPRSATTPTTRTPSARSGKVGVAIDSLEDMETLFDAHPARPGLDLDDDQRHRGDPAGPLRGGGAAAGDPGGGALGHGAERHPQGVRGARDLDLPARPVDAPGDRPVRLLRRPPCRSGTRSRSPGYHIREAGATAPQELAFTFANALEYVRAAKAAGLDPDRFGERLSFFFACHSDFLEEVAKFRCARRLWARLMKERFGVTNPKAQQCRFHVQTGGVTLTAQQPDNNVVRVALQTLAAVLGGCQSLHTNGRDEALALPTEASARLALRTQQVVAHESGVGRRPWTRSGAATRSRRRPTRSSGRRCGSSTGSRRAGGALAAIERGDVQREIQESAYRYQRQVESGERVIVGVNRFQEEGEEPPGDILRIDAEVERDQVARVRALRARRPAGPWRAAARRARGEGALRREPRARRWWTRSWPGPRSARSRPACEGSSESTGRRSSCEREPGPARRGA